jgi:hypothetical protein
LERENRLRLEVHRAHLNAARLSRLTQVVYEGHITELASPNQLQYGSHGLSAIFHHELQHQNQVHHRGGAHLLTKLLRSVKGVIRGIKSASRLRGRQFCGPAESRRQMESSGAERRMARHAMPSVSGLIYWFIGLLMYGSMTPTGCRR